jgi:hypothetical protein
MKVKASRETVEKLIALQGRFDTSTEQYLEDLPTPEKYAILAMALIVRGDYTDFEIAHDESMQKVPAQALTKHLLNFPCLHFHLQDALRLGWTYFEVEWADEDDEDEEKN